MAWDEWIDLASIKALSQHASATLTAFACFGVIDFVAKRMQLSELTTNIVDAIEEMVLVGLLIWFVYQMGLVLWKRRLRLRDEVRDSVDAT
jgi:hypothetical protein